MKWSVVCTPKEEGGLGVRDVRVVNWSLLAKWKWRLIQDGHALWKDVLVEKYGNSCVGLVVSDEYMWPANVSRWWGDLVRLDVSNWFNSKLTREVRNGVNTSFWDVAWRGEISFWEKYPRLFSLSTQKEAMVGDVGAINSMDTNWTFLWRRPLFVWENELLSELLEDLESFRGSIEDGIWWWRLEGNGVFSVKSMYKKLELLLAETTVSVEHRRVFTHIWKSPAPSKLVVFSWKLFHDRIPTKVNLRHRQVLPLDDSVNCVLCEGNPESASYFSFNAPLLRRGGMGC